MLSIAASGEIYVDLKLLEESKQACKRIEGRSEAEHYQVDCPVIEGLILPHNMPSSPYQTVFILKKKPQGSILV